MPHLDEDALKLDVLKGIYSQRELKKMHGCSERTICRRIAKMKETLGLVNPRKPGRTYGDVYGSRKKTPLQNTAKPVETATREPVTVHNHNHVYLNNVEHRPQEVPPSRPPSPKHVTAPTAKVEPLASPAVTKPTLAPEAPLPQSQNAIVESQLDRAIRVALEEDAKLNNCRVIR